MSDYEKLTWRVGGKVPLNVYEGDTPMFQCHKPEQAARIVKLLNAAPAHFEVVRAAKELDAANTKYVQACCDADPDDLDGHGDPEMHDYFTIEMWEALRSALANLEK